MKGLRLGLSLTGDEEFTPASLFTGQAGAWYDPSDISTLFQDSAGTTPVTAHGDPVGRILDKSGNGRHLTQGTAGSRPLYQVDGSLKFLLFDGTDDFLGIGTATLTLPFDRVSAIRQVTWAANDTIFGGSVGGSLKQSGSSPNLRIHDGAAVGGVNTLTLGTDGVVTERHIANASQIAHNNGAYNTADCGATNPNQFAIGSSIASSGGACANFRFYGLVQRTAMTAAEIALLRTYLGGKIGLSL